MAFKRATREKAKLRVGIEGPAKSGKTMTALILATAAVERFGGRIALIDTERGSASKYAPLGEKEKADGINTFDFDSDEFDSFNPTQFIKAIKEAEAAGYTVLIVDSLSHEWMGSGGVLQMVEAATDQNRFARWKTPSQLHSKLIDTILQADLHVICTMRSKMAYEQVEEEGRKKIRKLGLQPIQRDGVEYEFDVVISMNTDVDCRVSGSRCPDMPNGTTTNRPDGSFFTPLLNWVSEGAEPKPKPKKKAKAKAPSNAQKGSPEVPSPQKMWEDFLEEYKITHDAALKALGTKSVAEWTKVNKGKILVDAMNEIVAVMGLVKPEEELEPAA